MIAEILSIVSVHDASMMKVRHHPDAAGGGVCEIAGIRTCNVNMPGSCRNWTYLQQWVPSRKSEVVYHR